MNFQCPECKEQGVEKVFKFPTGLGAHRKFQHGIAGTSSSSIASRKVKQGYIGRARCFYCSRTFDSVNGRSKHIVATHPGKSLKGLGPMKKAVPVQEREIAADRALAAFTVGQMKNECKHIAESQGRPEREFILMVAEYFNKMAGLV